MNAPRILPFALACCLCCTGNKAVETPTEIDSVADTIATAPVTAVVAETQPEPLTPLDDEYTDVAGELRDEKGELVYVLRNQYSFVSDPYAFSLDASAIEELLGEEATTKVENFEAGEDYSAYSYYTVTFKDTKISFYDYPGKHFSHVTTPLLPMKNGIIIGMKKADFMNAIAVTDTLALQANDYRMVDDYGSMDFYFRSDTLYLIHAYYEEGD